MEHNNTPINLCGLTETQKNALGTRVEKWHGRVRIFVHPMYEKWRGYESLYKNDPDKVRLVQIENVLARLLAMQEDKTPPIIIFEEKIFAEKLGQWLRENPYGHSQTGTYVVETVTNNPAPISGEVWEDRDEVWRMLCQTLHEIGARKIVMAGMQLEVSEYRTDWTGKSPFMARCVGIAISRLSKDKGGTFDVELSALIDPPEERSLLASIMHKQRQNRMLALANV